MVQMTQSMYACFARSAIGGRTSSSVALVILILSSQVLSLHHSSAQTSARVQSSGLDVDVAGNVYLVNSERCTVTRLDQDLKVLAEIGGPGWGPGSFDRPLGIWARNGLDIYLADYGNHRIQRFDRTLSFVSQLFTRDSDNPGERFGYPTDVALSRMGALFICDSENGRILKLNRQNQVETTFGGIGGGKGRLLAPTRLEIGPADKVYVLDGPRIAVFDMFGNFLQELYLPTAGEPKDFFGTEEAFLVLGDNVITCFDAAEHPVGTLDLSTVQALQGSPVTAIAANRSRLFLLTEDHLIVIPNPFPPAGSDQGSVERDRKND